MRFTLGSKMTFALVSLVALQLVSSVAAIVSVERMEHILDTIVVENLASVRAAEELEIALLEQRGHVSSYILDNRDVRWLEQLNMKRNQFDFWLKRARQTARSRKEQELLSRLEIVQRAYASRRDQVVELYDEGEREQAIHILLNDVANLYQQTYELCEQFIQANQEIVDEVVDGVGGEVDRITALVAGLAFATIVLGLTMIWLFFQTVILPLRKLTAGAKSITADTVRAQEPGDELRELGHYLQLLMTDVETTRSDLQQSRMQLALADKLATVGKLAASVAHEIRNPLTAIKMWLYALRQGLSDRPELQQKLTVVSTEILRLEKIVHHFLEFSRPPPLRTASHRLGDLVDKSLELMKYRLEQHDTGVVVSHHADTATEVWADAEQLRQVLLNLLNNALEAMEPGGEIRISSRSATRNNREMIALAVEDSGSGMAAGVREHIFEPFFSTKEAGTGLGLCIAASVMTRHGGLLELERSDENGTCWIVWIPVKGTGDGQDSGH
jgi:signal transduction histidine kinase